MVYQIKNGAEEQLTYKVQGCNDFTANDTIQPRIGGYNAQQSLGGLLQSRGNYDWNIAIVWQIFNCSKESFR